MKRVVLAVVTLAIVAVLFVAVFPTQALLQQRCRSGQRGLLVAQHDRDDGRRMAGGHPLDVVPEPGHQRLPLRRAKDTQRGLGGGGVGR